MSDDTQKNQTYTIDLQPIGRRVEVEPGITLLEAAQRGGVDLVASCGGVGICATCRVRHAGGEVTPISITEIEELGEAQIAKGYRLACQTEPLSDVLLEIPADSLSGSQKLQLEGKEQEVALLPAVVAVDLVLKEPNLEDLRSDVARIDEELAPLGFGPLRANLELYGRLSFQLRRDNWQVRLAIRPNGDHTDLVSVLPTGSDLVGLAMDIGSTKVAIYLIDLKTGVTLTKKGVANPQISYGEDVISRIAYANRGEDNRLTLQARLVDAINDAVAEFCEELGLNIDQLVDVVAVGNTAIHHLFSGLPVEQLGSSPYVPVVSAPLEFATSEIRLKAAPGARVYMPANIAGYVGADHVSALLASYAYASPHTSLLVDIGTNTEVSLVHEGQIYSCSCASGPAFEGAHIHDGMRAAPGAIDRLRIRNGKVALTTIGNAPPVGICGSGILNAVSELLNAGIVNENGIMVAGTNDRLRKQGRQMEFILVPEEETGHGQEILVTRKDVNEIQLAKGAIRAGIELLLKEANIPADEVDDFIVAGAFGTYLDLKSAVRVGMFPNLPLERFQQIGNAAGVGAKEMLVSSERRAEAARIVHGINYIELTTHKDFTPTFVESMYFGRNEDQNDTVVN